MIQKVPGGYKVVSHQTGRSFGTYATRSEAEERLRQMKGHSDDKKPKQRPPYHRGQHPNN